MLRVVIRAKGGRAISFASVPALGMQTSRFCTREAASSCWETLMQATAVQVSPGLSLPQAPLPFSPGMVRRGT